MTVKAKTEYALNDFIDISKGKATFEDIAKKYGVSSFSVRRAFNRRGFRYKSLPVVAKYNGKAVRYHSANECANKLGVARQTVVRSIKGHKTILDKLEIEVEVCYDEELYD